MENRLHKRRRLKGWDYYSPAMYFVTFCTKNRARILAEIIESNDSSSENLIKLSAVGRSCEQALKLAVDLCFPVSIKYYVIMPNHVHAVVDLTQNANYDPMPLWKVIALWKQKTTSLAHSLGFNGQVWQPSFNDHVVRDENDLFRVIRYIKENPKKWAFDEYCTQEDS